MTKGQTRHGLGAVLCILALLPCASCSDGKSEMEEEMTAAGEDAPVTMSLTIQTRAIQSNVENYERGSKYENYIDINGGDYKICFFTNYEATDDKADPAADTYITSFEPNGYFVTEGDDYYTYSVVGEVPTELLAYSNFKVVMLANWGSYGDLEVGETTIDDICGETWSEDNHNHYTHLENFELGPGKLIPFYGVHDYEDITFEKGKAVTLPKPVTLLRAMAKVEVVLDVDKDKTFSFEYVTLHRYNEEGYCAPEKVYSKDDYDHDYTWNSDFVDDVHLVNGYNDGNGTPVEKELPFLQTKERSDEDEETWVAYAPEYDNTTEIDDYSYIEVKLKGYDKTYKIYFANYDDDGKTTAYSDAETDFSDRYDIRRNYLYRFVVSVGNDIRVFVRKWDNTYENVFEFIDSSAEN